MLQEVKVNYSLLQVFLFLFLFFTARLFVPRTDQLLLFYGIFSSGTLYTFVHY